MERITLIGMNGLAPESRESVGDDLEHERIGRISDKKRRMYGSGNADPE